MNDLLNILKNPPKHRYWMAGEADCPEDIKAGNGELHTLRCKVCGEDGPRNKVCLAQVDANEILARVLNGLGYQRVFNAIGDAVTIRPDATAARNAGYGIGISVEKFIQSLCSADGTDVIPSTSWNAQAKAALKPFADAAHELDFEMAPDLMAEDDMAIEHALYTHQQPTVGDLRAARKALLDVPDTHMEEVLSAAHAVIQRWDTPLWKDVEPTGHVINRLRAACAKIT